MYILVIVLGLCELLQDENIIFLKSAILLAKSVGFTFIKNNIQT